MNISFWEFDSWFKDLDLIVIGSGIVGLNTAIEYKKLNKKSKILILEKGILPEGASTKNAGFACFGSPSELLFDVEKTGFENTQKLVERRIKGLELLKKNLGPIKIDYKNLGGYEVFDSINEFEKCNYFLPELNSMVSKFTQKKITYTDSTNLLSHFGLEKGFNKMIKNSSEGQIDTGKMMHELMKLAHSFDIKILNSCPVLGVNDNSTEFPEVKLNNTILKSRKIAICTNGFFNDLFPKSEYVVNPARAQVLITKPIENLKLKGSFHYNEGFYYFRNVGNRVLLGGGRNLDFKNEQTTKMEFNHKIQTKLSEILETRIIPYKKLEIEQRWTGIMGLGENKTPFLKRLSSNVICATKLGGMGVALGSLLGKEAADLLFE